MAAAPLAASSPPINFIDALAANTSANNMESTQPVMFFAFCVIFFDLKSKAIYLYYLKDTTILLDTGILLYSTTSSYVINYN
jgi:hypothetical protein